MIVLVNKFIGDEYNTKYKFIIFNKKLFKYYKDYNFRKYKF